MRTVLLVIGLGVLGSSTAEACNRCRRFGNQCVYYRAPVVQQQAYVAPVYAPVAAYNSPDVYVVNNVYPQPNGQLGALAQQGNSYYGASFQQAAIAHQVNEMELARQAYELGKASLATASMAFSGHTSVAQSAITLKTTVSEPLAKSYAASQVLSAAGLSQPSAASQQTSLSLKISQGSDGRWQVHSADPAQVQAEIAASINEQSQTQPQHPTGPGVERSILREKCEKCHSTQFTNSPGGELVLDHRRKLSGMDIWRSLRAVDDGTMPKNGPPLTAEEKGLLFRELRALELE